MAQRRTCTSRVQGQRLLLRALCFSTLLATGFCGASLGGRDASSAPSKLGHPSTASGSGHAAGEALNRSDSSSRSAGSARGILQADSAQQGAVAKATAAGRKPGGAQQHQATQGSSPGEEAFDAYNDYELYTKGYDYDKYVAGGGAEYDPMDGDYFFDEVPKTADCRLSAKGKPVLTGSYKGLCRLVLSGANEHVPLLTGGLDGTYVLHSCESSRPTYLRQKSPAGQDRLLWYSAKHKDWDVSNGTKANEEDILLYGGEGAGDMHMHPEFVATDKWHIAADFHHLPATADYVQANITVKCAGVFKGTPAAPKQTNFGTKPFITPEEMEEQYRGLYTKVKSEKEAANRSSDVVFMFVVFFIAVAAVLCTLLCISRRRLARKGGNRAGWISLVPLGSTKAAD